jgi:hypothetical protein
MAFRLHLIFRTSGILVPAQRDWNDPFPPHRTWPRARPLDGHGPAGQSASRRGCEGPALRRRVRWSLETAGAEAGELATELANHMKKAMDRIDVEQLLKPERVRLAGQPEPGSDRELQSIIDNFADHPKAGAGHALLAS